MGKKYKSPSLLKFQSVFPEYNKCVKYLADLMWKNGYPYKKYGYTQIS